MRVVSIIGHEAAADTPTPGTIGQTPGDEPNIKVGHVVTPLLAIGVRMLNVFLLTFFALLGGDPVAKEITGIDLIQVPEGASPTLRYLYFAAVAAVLEGGKSLLTIGKRLEEKYPLLTGSI